MVGAAAGLACSLPSVRASSLFSFPFPLLVLHVRASLSFLVLLLFLPAGSCPDLPSFCKLPRCVVCFVLLFGSDSTQSSFFLASSRFIPAAAQRPASSPHLHRHQAPSRASMSSTMPKLRPNFLQLHPSCRAAFRQHSSPAPSPGPPRALRPCA